MALQLRPGVPPLVTRWFCFFFLVKGTAFTVEKVFLSSSFYEKRTALTVGNRGCPRLSFVHKVLCCPFFNEKRTVFTVRKPGFSKNDQLNKRVLGVGEIRRMAGTRVPFFGG